MHMEDPADIDMRCSVAAFRGDSVLLVHRRRDDADDWVLPGGTPRPGESMASCARREALEETGLVVELGRIAFVLEAHGPDDTRRCVDLVFLATLPDRSDPGPTEDGLEAAFVALGELPRLTLRPPIAGHLRGLHARGTTGTAAYLGNLWRPGAGNGSSFAPETAGRSRE
jgi:8-oxo-dGTP diphosphatase